VSLDAGPPAGAITQVERPAGYVFTHEANDAFVAVNRLLAGGEAVYWLTREFRTGGNTWPIGSHYVRAGASTLGTLEQLARDTGLSFQAVARPPDMEALQLKPVRIALWDQYGGSAASGWARLVLEQFEFPYVVVYPKTLDAGDLAAQFDVLILAADAVFSTGEARALRNVPQEYAGRIGSLSPATTVPQLKTFMEAGGTVLALGKATSLGLYTSLPIKNTVAGLPETKFYVPGSILQARVAGNNPMTYGLPERADLFFDRSPVFKLDESARKDGLRPLVWFDSDKSLRSGWALGQAYLKGTAAVLEANVGKGKLVLYGPDILFRSQPHGIFKLLFNGIYAGHAKPVDLK
jgi:hypothetical protein